MNETKLQFMWWEGKTDLTSIQLDCTIPLMVGDAMVYKYKGIEYHLEVERRIYVPENNTLAIVFKTT